MVCELVDIATLNLGVRAECFQGEGALSGNLRRHLIVRRSANIDVVLKRTLNSDGNGFESLKEWKVTGGGGVVTQSSICFSRKYCHKVRQAGLKCRHAITFCWCTEFKQLFVVSYSALTVAFNVTQPLHT